MNKVVGENGDIRATVPKMRVEVLYLDSLSSEGEISKTVGKRLCDPQW